jgi:hypothetical protein
MGCLEMSKGGGDRCLVWESSRSSQIPGVEFQFGLLRLRNTTRVECTIVSLKLPKPFRIYPKSPIFVGHWDLSCANLDLVASLYVYTYTQSQENPLCHLYCV